MPASALAIAAHPDDVEFGCGATLAKWAAAGCVVHHLVLTDGSKGTWDVHADTAELVVTRRAEQREAARRLRSDGPGTVTFLDWPDGELESGVQQRWQVCAVIRRLKPQVVLGHDPWKRYRLHPDHRNAGFLACDGVVAARDPHFFPEQDLPHHRPEAMLLWEADEPNHVEDATPGFEAKLHALMAHESQFRSTMKAVEPAELEAFAERLRRRAASLGEPHGLAAAELFRLIPDL